MPAKNITRISDGHPGAGDANNCALANGGSAAECQTCGGECPDAPRLLRGLGVVAGVAALAGLQPVPDVSFAHTSESVEHFTPYDVAAAATVALGGAIDLDPASCARANEYIEATTYYDAASNGLAHEWSGTVFLNPPGGLCDGQGRPVYPRTRKREGCSTTGACGLAPGHKHEGVTSSAKFWWARLAREWRSGRVRAAVFVGFSLEQLCNTQTGAQEGDLLPLDCVFCVPSRRLQYLREDQDGHLVPGESPPHASYIAYLGPYAGAFIRAFKPLGRVVYGHHDPDGSFHPNYVEARKGGA